MEPLVTVIACCYNHSTFVVESLESIRQQTYPRVQLIVTDDASTDDSDAVITDWISRHQMSCTYLRHRTNKGICKTLNEALSHATGKYIAIVATDDLWMPDKLKHQVGVMEGLPQEIGVLYSDAYQIDKDGSLLPGMYIESMYRRAGKDFSSYPEGDIFSTLIENNFIPGMTALIRSKCFNKVGMYDERLCFEDWDMWFRISQHFKFVYSSKVSARYRILSTSACRTLCHDRRLHEQHPLGPRVHGWALASNFLLREKCLAYSRISAHDRQELLDVMRWIVKTMYQHRLVERHMYCWKLFRQTRSLSAITMFLFSVSGLSFSSFDRFYMRYLRSGLFRMRSKILESKGMPKLKGG